MPESPVFELRVVLTAENYEAALAFWREGLGLPMERAFESADGKGALFAAGRATVEILSAGSAAGVDRAEVGHTVEAPVRLALEVANSGAAADQLELAGAKRLGPLVDTPWGHRNVRLETPAGLQLTLFTVVKE